MVFGLTLDEVSIYAVMIMPNTDKTSVQCKLAIRCVFALLYSIAMKYV